MLHLPVELSVHLLHQSSFLDRLKIVWNKTWTSTHSRYVSLAEYKQKELVKKRRRQMQFDWVILDEEHVSAEDVT